MFEHDTYYYGYAIVSLIENLFGKPSVDRGNLFIWVDTRNTSRVIFLDLKEQNNRGTLEIHQHHSRGTYIDGISSILDVNDSHTDYILNKDKITDFLNKYCA